MCILTFLLPILAGLALNLLSDISFSSVSETAFAAVKGNLTSDTINWLKSLGRVEILDNMQEFENAINEPATQLIGVIQKKKRIASVLSGDEL